MKRLIYFISILIVVGLIAAGCSDNNDNKNAAENDNASEVVNNNDADNSNEAENKDDANAENNDKDQAESSGAGTVVIQGDTINSHEVEDAICVVNSRFEQGWRMVFRASVTDAETGESIDDADVKVVLEDGQEFEMEYADHGAGDVETMLYTIAWTIPDDYPTGTLEYKYIATVDGEEYEYEPFDVDLSKMTIIEPEEGETKEG